MEQKSAPRSVHEEIRQRLISLGDRDEAVNLERFFKTGPGEYGFGDKFLGVRVPVTRSIVREYKDKATTEDCCELIKSEWHEIRLSGFLLLIELFRKSRRQRNEERAERIVRLYLEHIDKGNNWDLVDLVCGNILGDWLVDHPAERSLLDSLADRHDSLWHQRVAIVSTLSLIKNSMYDETLRIAEKFLTHRHDLIHKATGWMLREMGKRGGRKELLAFLDVNAPRMPRTALRYAIERFPEDLRKHYMGIRF